MELMIILFAGLGLMMFMTIRKQKKMVQQQQELQDSIETGDRVVTTSGLYGTVADASDPTTLKVEIADGVVTEWLRQAIREKVGDDPIDELAESVGLTSDETDGVQSEAKEATEATETATADNADGQQSGAQIAPSLDHRGK